MKLGIVISSNGPETVWNAFRLGKFAFGQGGTVNVLLLGKGVECESLDMEHFAVTKAMQELSRLTSESDRVLTF